MFCVTNAPRSGTASWPSASATEAPMTISPARARARVPWPSSFRPVSSSCRMGGAAAVIAAYRIADRRSFLGYTFPTEEDGAMQLGMIGLGRMGANMVRRLMRGGHSCVVHDVSAEATRALAQEGAVPGLSLDELVAKLTPPRAIWLMVPAARGRRDARLPDAAAREGRRGDRRRQLVLPGRRRSRQAARRPRHSLCRLRHQRRRLRSRARLLPDDRRRARGGAPARSDLRHAGARPGDHPADAGARRRAASAPERRRKGTCTAAPPARATS